VGLRHAQANPYNDSARICQAVVRTG